MRLRGGADRSVPSRLRRTIGPVEQRRRTGEPNAPVSALPSAMARGVAFLAIVLAGCAGALIGYGFTDLQCTGDCATASGVGALVGAVLAAAGTAVIAVLVLRAMTEWRRGRSPAAGD